MSFRQTENKRRMIYSLQDLSAGLFTDVNAYNLPEGAAQLAENIIYNADKSISPRRGYGTVMEFPPLQITATRGTRSGQITALSDLSVHRELQGIGSTQTPVKQILDTPEGPLLFDSNNTYIYYNNLILTAHRVAPSNVVPHEIGGTLQVGSFINYFFTYLYGNGIESAPYQLGMTVPANGGIRFTFDPTVPLDALYVRLYRQTNTMAVPLLIAQVQPNLAYVNDTGQVSASLTLSQDLVDMESSPIATLSNGRLWVMDGSTLYYSNPYSVMQRSAYNFEPITMPDNDVPTAIAPYGQGVIIFSRTGAVQVTGPTTAGGSIIPLQLSEGCISQNAWTTGNNALFFVGPNGLWTLQNGQSQEVAPHVRSLFQNLLPENVSLVYEPTSGIFYVTTGANVITAQTRAGSISVSTWTLKATGGYEYRGKSYFIKDFQIIQFNQNLDPQNARVKVSWVSAPNALVDNTMGSGSNATYEKLVRRAEMLIAFGGSGNASLSINSLFGETLANPPKVVGDIDTNTVLWGTAIWGTAVWANPNAPQRVQLVSSSNVVGTHISISITLETDRPLTTVLIAPISIEYRMKDRFGRVQR